MKSRVNLTPELQKLVEQTVQARMAQERGTAAVLFLQLAMHTLASPPYDWGQKRLEDFWTRAMDNFNGLTADYGMDCWIDKILADLDRKGITFLGDGYAAKPTPKMPKPMSAYTAEGREAALQKLLRRGWMRRK